MARQVTILLPNYKTPDLTRLCLRLLRKHTDPDRIHVIVIDNDSADDSTQYLRSLRWIQLIERPKVPGESPSLSHSNALDQALASVTTPYVLSFHTDTLVKRNDWLDFLVGKISEDPNIAGVGSWKLETKSRLELVGKQIEDIWQFKIKPLFKKHAQHGPEAPFLRSHCALYRMEYVKQYHLSFGDGDTAGKIMHEKLIAHGHRMLFVPSEQLSQYLIHINHATMVINPELGARKRTISKGAKRSRLYLKEIGAEAILQDRSLDN